MFTDPTDVAALWPTWAPLHRVLLRLAGRMPDDWLEATRAKLAEDDVTDLPATIAGSLITLGVPVTGEDVDVLRQAQAAVGGPGQEGLIDRVPVVAQTPPTGHAFTPTGPSDGLELADMTALVLVDRDDVARIDRAWRTGPTPDTPARWIYLVEYDPGAPAWTAPAEVRSLALDAGSVPAVEAYWSGEPLPPYLRNALQAATGLWQRPADRRGGPEARLNRLLAAARAGDREAILGLVDWPLTGAPQVVRALRRLPAEQRAGWARDWVPGLVRAGGSVESVERVLRDLVPMLADASGFRPAEPAERRDLLARFAVDQPPAGVPDDERARLADLGRRSAGLDEVYLVLAGDVVLPLAYAPDSDRLVVLFE